MESAQTAVQTCNTDAELVQATARGDHAAFEALMRTHNRQLFRVARAILKDDADAEEALQEAYITAYTRLAAFRGESKLATWLTRIVSTNPLGACENKRSMRWLCHFLLTWNAKQTNKMY